MKALYQASAKGFVATVYKSCPLGAWLFNGLWLDNQHHMISATQTTIVQVVIWSSLPHSLSYEAARVADWSWQALVSRSHLGAETISYSQPR